MNQQDRGYDHTEPPEGGPVGADDAPAPFSVLLRGYRKRAGLTQEMLAEKAGLGVNTIGNLERAVSQPYRDTVKALASALELSPDEQAALAAAADRGRAALVRAADPDDAPAAGRKNPLADERADKYTSSAGKRSHSGWLPMVVERGRRDGVLRNGLLVVAIVVAILGATMVAGPRLPAAPQAHQVQLRASGSSCGSEGGWPILCLGARGTPVYVLQYLLNSYDPTYNLTVDGVFGSRTRHAVQDFQHRNAVQGDAPGITGIWTWSALTGQMAVHLHSAGSDVLALQYLLNHDPASLGGRLSLDGSYGPKTQRALAGAERSLGLPATDRVTPAVWRTLLCATTRGCRVKTHSH